MWSVVPFYPMILASFFAADNISYKSVESILKTNLDKQELPESSSPEKPILHYNIRGREYYQQKEAAHA